MYILKAKYDTILFSLKLYNKVVYLEQLPLDEVMGYGRIPIFLVGIHNVAEGRHDACGYY
jgi:hypothetical protein